MRRTSTDRNNRMVRWFRGLLAAAIVIGGVSLTQSVQAEELKIGYVDLHKALNQVEEGKQAKKKLKADFQKKQKKLDAKQKKVKKLKKELEDQSMALSDEAKKKKQMKLQKEMAELQRQYMKLQKNLSQQEAKATKEIFGKMRKVVRGIAEEKGYDLVLEKRGSSVLFAKDSMDLTDELIERFESQ